MPENIGKDKPLVMGSKGNRNRDKNVLEIILPSKATKELEKLLLDAGYKKGLLGNNWNCPIRNYDVVEAEKVARIITGNRVMG